MMWIYRAQPAALGHGLPRLALPKAEAAGLARLSRLTAGHRQIQVGHLEQRVGLRVPGFGWASPLRLQPKKHEIVDKCRVPTLTATSC